VKKVPLKKSRLAAIALFLCLAGAMVSSHSAAQDVPKQTPLQYEVTVTLKLIQVYVTDKSGKPVADLTKDDFAVLDNGKPVSVTAFEWHELRFAPPAAEVPQKEEKRVLADLEPRTINRKFIILFDLAFNSGHGVAASVKAALDFLDTKVAPEDEAAFISYSMLKGLRVHESLTSDHAKVRKAVAAVTARDISGRADELEQAYWQMVEIAQSSSLENPQAADELRRMEWQRQDSAHQAQNYFLSLTALARALRLIQGQKSVLFFSAGVPSSLVNTTRSVGTDTRFANTGTTSWGSTGSTFDIGNSVLRPLQETMLKEFSASNCSFYAFDTRESSKVFSPFAYDEIQSMTRASGGMKSADGVNQAITNPFRNDKTTGMDSLKRLSDQTGGHYYSNIVLYEKNLEQVSDITRSYYVLGYSISSAADGKFHDVKVEVKRMGCQVRAQRGYFNPKPFREYTNLERDLHLFDLALNERSEFAAPKALPVSALSYDSGQGTRARVLARIPKDIWDKSGGKTAELVALFFDEQENLLSLQRATVSSADYLGKELLFTAGTRARPGLIKCRVVVRDLETGASAVGSTKSYIGKPNSQGLSVHSPMLIVGGGGLFLLEGKVKGSLESPPWRDAYPYDTAAFSPIIGGEAVKAGKVGVIVPYSVSGVSRPDVVFRANLVNSATGENLTVRLELRESSRRGGIEVQNLELSLDNVPPGTYLLYIHAADKLSGATASAHIPLTIGR
jgi:VWFA-related protein